VLSAPDVATRVVEVHSLQRSGFLISRSIAGVTREGRDVKQSLPVTFTVRPASMRATSDFAHAYLPRRHHE
jgi:hypothetical protein